MASAFCIDMHWKDARAAGETEQRLYGLPAWRESPYYTDRERAALLLAEQLTKIADRHVPEEVFAEVGSHFNDQEHVDLCWVIAAINAWNRVSIGSRTVPGESAGGCGPLAVHSHRHTSAAGLRAATTRRFNVKIVVIGGTGLIGSKVVSNLKDRGHEAVAASPKSGVTLTGEGLSQALAGVQVEVRALRGDLRRLRRGPAGARPLRPLEALRARSRAVSVGVVGGEPLLDLDYSEDSTRTST